MKRKKIFSLPLLLVAIGFSGCIKQLEKKYAGPPLAEFDAAVLNSNNADAGYPVLTRFPRPAIPINATNSTTSCALPQADSTIRRIGGTVSIRVNLIGAQSSETRVVGYTVLSAAPFASFSFPATVAAITTTAATCGTSVVFPAQTPAAPAAVLSVVNAVPGVHYTALSGKLNIPANSSFGDLQIPLISGTATAGRAVFIGIQLDSTGTVLPSLNYRRIGILVDQR
ncbi:MAG: hypothetical protein EAY75_07525 [Bacteroidetes bacterium]|nr:MAG: hypothetical protein EAY75_07525 [Bacteroidota bacterium]